jgi:hypothetical protein
MAPTLLRAIPVGQLKRYPTTLEWVLAAWAEGRLRLDDAQG